ncbi:heme-binding protein [Alteribacillus sp. JSM 102045]|uniref:GlcG/HbpS family heme-binding protein n=1 Tax=Alteribacillus sp. JSM 102045 TaxID=1562101 RepID=UPI0035C15909
MERIDLNTAKKAMEQGEEKAKSIGVPMVITIVNDEANFIASHRMDGALLASVDISQNKAWTSAALKMSTSQLSENSKNNGELFGINSTNNGKVVIFGGGIPLYVNNNLVGAVGVSGGSVNEDIEVAQAVEDFINKLDIESFV